MTYESRPSRCPKCGADLALKHPMWVNEELTRSRILCGCGHSIYYTERRLPPLPPEIDKPETGNGWSEFVREMALEVLRRPWRDLATKLLVKLDKPVTKETVDHYSDWLYLMATLLQLNAEKVAKFLDRLAKDAPPLPKKEPRERG